MAPGDCRICGHAVEELVDLGAMPPANELPDFADFSQARFPLTLDRCRACRNLQLRHCLPADVLYGHYYYSTPVSSTLDAHYTWLERILFDRGYADGASSVVEIGSNRGAFLKSIGRSVRTVLGVDPAANIVDDARRDGVDTVCAFFDRDSARAIVNDRGSASLIVARHCMAHNEWPQRMLEGVRELLDTEGVLVVENNYAGQMVPDVEFDQIYHEHMYYYSLSSLSELLRRNGLRAIDVEIASVHGGSIVCFAVREESSRPVHDRVRARLAAEESLLSEPALRRFADRTRTIRDELRTVVAGVRAYGHTLGAYGATAKGATLLNFCGFTGEHIDACADSTPMKIGRYVPGTGIRIVAESGMLESPPDFLLLTAWNFKNELIKKVRDAGASKTKFIVPIPRVEVVT